jgi:hypothetical protein
MLPVRGSDRRWLGGSQRPRERSPLADFREPSFVTELSNRVVAELEFRALAAWERRGQSYRRAS